MIRVVADTNIYISAWHFGGVADQVLALAREKSFELYISEPIIREIEGVLIYKFNWSKQRVEEAAAVIAGFSQGVVPTIKLDQIEEDDADNRILECAVAAQAHFIISGDLHLLQLNQFILIHTRLRRLP